jgi:molybdopterin-biosynthesis enzyme MoeA-like protein
LERVIIGSKLISTKNILHPLDISKKEIHAVIIGDEILSGKREDKHLKHLSKTLKNYGLWLSKVDYIPDDLEVIRKTIREKIGSIVFCFGGIGATPDDCTRHAAALAHKNPIVQNSEAKRLIENQFGKDAYPKRILMADLPDNAELIPNVINNIPGFFINHHHFMPGFPEMAWPMIDWVINNHYKILINLKDVEDKSIWLDGVSESMLIDTMNEIKNKNKEIKIYSLPKLRPNKTLELGIKGPSKNVNKAMKDLKNQLEKLKFNWREN